MALVHRRDRDRHRGVSLADRREQPHEAIEAPAFRRMVVGATEQVRRASPAASQHRRTPRR